MPHPNEATLHQAYATFAQGDVQGYLKYCTDNITFHVPGRSQVAGDYTREQFASSLIGKVMGLTNGSFRETVNDVVANDTRGIVFLTHEFERQGKSFSYKVMHVYRIREGKLAEFAEYPDDQYLFDEAWG